ncbi:hypothetical protein [Novosphingobium lindaniclasticum]|uniref:J domain-containing protein n=1 Tax=Novosphingobium lindaniclasticum LE124 TaxID=1096930 RepID=T0I2G3_9SPHN|nr:hypothetical protein [Novosphingobium lindaniclasticum]EQB19517.1 hypothetical protein L284_00995 [Novosphingobium lindaniclasticum LE124]
MSAPWSILGIGRTADAAAIRKAYAARLKAMDVDSDVEGFARLRQARDQALRLARTMAEAAEDGGKKTQPIEPTAEAGEFAPSPEAPRRWIYAAPDLDGAWSRADLAARPGEPDDTAMLGRMAWAAAAAREGVSGAGIPLTTIDPFTAPLLPGNHAADEALGLRPGESPAERLAILLDPESATAGEPLCENEARQAMRALRKILDDAAQAQITRAQQIEDWLAEVLARGWPRSAPLLEDANAAFGWEREWAAHDARPGVAFLGARLRGYRFQQSVLQPGHRFHKAWNELVRPGKASPFRLLRGPAQGEVDSLLRGVRQNFPELETHFAPERVASWEGGNPFASGLLIFFGVVALGIVLALANGPYREGASLERETWHAMQSAIPEAFGEGHDTSWLWNKQPELAGTLNAQARNLLEKGENQAAVVNRVVEIVRSRSFLNGRELSEGDLDTVMRLRLAQLRAARAQSPAACIRVRNSGMLPGATPVPEALRAQERTLAAHLAEAGKLARPKDHGDRSALVPGKLIDQVVAATRLDHAAVKQAMSGKSDDASGCAVTIALLDRTLAWKGENRREILMTL